MAKLSKVEKAKILVGEKDVETFKLAKEEIPSIEEKVGKLSEKQMAYINERFCIDPVNTLESLKISLKNGYIKKAVLQYKELKMVLNIKW
ncbi:MAG: hypothetical protein IKE95_09770 [Methanobrevibacter sp.]|nr:hypothetical protein [Methanobrevibacter sp.]